VLKVEKFSGKITIKHAPIKKLRGEVEACDKDRVRRRPEGEAMSAPMARSSSLLAIALTVVPAPGSAHEIKHAAMRIVHPWVLETEGPKVPLRQGYPPQRSSAIDAFLKAIHPEAGRA